METQIPDTMPEPSELTIGSVTVSSTLSCQLNLLAIANLIEIDQTIVGVKFQDIMRGVAHQPNKAAKKSFKNQCTLIVNDGTKHINVKVFNNGNLLLTGIADTSNQQAYRVTQIVAERLHQLQGVITYQITPKFKGYAAKDIFKKELQRYRHLIWLFIDHLGLDTDRQCFEPTLDKKVAFDQFQTTIGANIDTIKATDQSNLLGLLELFNIFVCYYTRDRVLEWTTMDKVPEFALQIAQGWDRINQTITVEAPAYLGNHRLEPKFADIKIGNIISRLVCNFPIDRAQIENLLSNHPQITNIDLDTDRYPGVKVDFMPKAQHNPEPNKVTIIWYMSGKVNILSSKSFEQAQEAYDFVVNFCRNHFKEILLTSQLINQARERQCLDDLPNQFELGEYEGTRFLLLKKSHIIRNPRNVMLLKRNGVLDHYIA